MPRNRHNPAHQEDMKQASGWSKWRRWLLVLLMLFRGFALWLPLGIGLFLTRGVAKT